MIPRQHLHAAVAIRCFTRAPEAARWLVASVLLFAAPPVFPAAYRPVDDAEIVERLPAAAALRTLAPLREELAREPGRLEVAERLAQAYVEIARDQADPRFLGYAEAVLAPWTRMARPPAAVLVLCAVILQSRHQFAPALALLDRALAQSHHDPQAWLTRAMILRVQGRLGAARTACGHLIPYSDALVALTCLSGVNALGGHLDAAYARLLASLQARAHAPAAVRAWALGELAEMAERRGEPGRAEQHLRAALAADDSPYLRAAYADLLLEQHRPAEVVTLLAGREQQDVLLLRLALAANLAGHPDAGRWSRMFAERYAAARREGDATHLREQARFVLWLQRDPGQALAVAQRNWAVQHEPDDVRIYLEAALAAARPQSARPVLDWIRANGYEDRRLTALLQRLAEGST